MTLRSRFGAVLAVLAFGTTGCSLLSPKPDPTRFYELTAVTYGPTTNPRTEAKTIVLSVDVAGHLQNPSLVQRLAPNQISYFSFDQWAQPLGDGVTQVLRTDLTQATGWPVLNATQSYVIREVYRVEIQLRRLDILPDQRVQLTASWLIRTNLGGDKLKQGEYQQERIYAADATSLQGAVAVFSELLGELSQALVTELP